jgi:hypothetical protein
MKPENANPRNFEVEKIIYNDDEFSVAYGRWKDQPDRQVGMRWNGDSEEDAGYPKVFGNPMWFVVSSDLKEILLRALLESPSADRQAILEILLKDKSLSGDVTMPSASTS